MKVFEPKIEVRLVKAIRREEVAPGLGAAVDRYKQLTDIDLTPYLSEQGGVRVTKGVRDPSGAFSITLADREHDALFETLYALIEPMDMVEIRFAHDPSDPDYQKYRRGDRFGLPVVMRGLVSTVNRSEVMSGQRPIRSVTIAGQDFGKVLELIQIFYLNNSVVGDNILSELAFFQKYVGPSEAKIRSAKDFVASLLDKVINPYLKRLTALADGSKIGAAVINSWTADVTIDGSVSPHSASAFSDVTLHQFLSALLDVGPFNELYVEDREDSVALVVRPVPFRGADGEYVQAGASAALVAIPAEDVQAMNVSRTDAGVANYFWVHSENWLMLSNEDAKLLAQRGNADDFITFNYPNTAESRYGVRKMEVGTRLGPSDYLWTDAQTKDQKPIENSKMFGWIDARRRALARMNRDNVVFEHGTLRVRGNERIKPGMFLAVTRGSTYSEFYVTRVDHSFIPFRGFFTTATVERGTGFLSRAQKAAGSYLDEINGEGVR